MTENNDVFIQTEESQKEKRRKKLIGWICIIAFLLILTVVFYFVGRPMIKFVDQPDKFRDWINAQGAWGRLIFVGMMALQIIVAAIPGEPLEIVAGYAFGVVEGTVLCMLGALIGGTVVFLFVKYFGIKVVDIFIPREKIAQLKFLNNPKKLTLLTTVIFLIPGTPKDILTYFVGLTPMTLTVWLPITSIARFPSVITSTLGGSALGRKEYIVAIVVFGLTLIISGIGLLIYKRISNKKSLPESKKEDASENPSDSTAEDAQNNEQK